MTNCTHPSEKIHILTRGTVLFCAGEVLDMTHELLQCECGAEFDTMPNMPVMEDEVSDWLP